MQILNEQMISGFPQAKVSDNAWKSILIQIFKKQVTLGFPRAKVSYDPQRNIWTLEEEYCYKDKIKGSEVIVGKDFKFDLSSIPRLFWIIIGTHELSLEAPLIHDFMYMSQGGKHVQNISGSIKPEQMCYSRKEADDLFLRMMQETGVSRWRRLLGYIGVRLFGGQHWKSNSEGVNNLQIATISGGINN